VTTLRVCVCVCVLNENVKFVWRVLVLCFLGCMRVSVFFLKLQARVHQEKLRKSRVSVEKLFKMTFILFDVPKKVSCAGTMWWFLMGMERKDETKKKKGSKKWEQKASQH
jgi:hypothetical protein